MSGLTTTLNKIRSHKPCALEWEMLLTSLGKTKADDEPLLIETILESNGIDDALWSLCTVDGYQNAMRLYACFYTRSLLPKFEAKYPNDMRPRQAIETAERFAHGEAAKEELKIAGEAAGAAGVAVAWEAWVAARVAWIAEAAAGEATWKATWEAAWEIDKYDLLKQEFIRLCRLEGEYGKVRK